VLVGVSGTEVVPPPPSPPLLLVPLLLVPLLLVPLLLLLPLLLLEVPPSSLEDDDDPLRHATVGSAIPTTHEASRIPIFTSAPLDR
jgi:hypothetical protein